MKVKYRIFLLMIFTIFLAGCSLQKGNRVESIDDKDIEDLSPSTGGEISLQLKNVETLNPLLSHNKGYYQLSKLIFDQLFVVEANGKIVPSLAEHFELSNNGYTLSVTLRDNIFWEDGTKLTAKDVADTFNALKFLPEESPYYQMLRHSATMAQDFDIKNFARALVFDERNIDFQFDKPYGNILEMLTFPILPSHLMTADQMVSKEDFILKGSGPFLLENYQENKEIRLVRNPNYHENVPYIETVLAKITENDDKAKQAFEAGQVDLFYMEDYTWDKYRANRGMKIETIQTNNLEILSLNMQEPIFQGEIGLALRQAIFRGINRKHIIDSLYLSQAREASFLINPEINSGLSVDDEIYYNLETADKILRQAGVIDKDGDGWKELPSGEKLQLNLATNTLDYLKKTEAEFIVEDLKALGIQSNIIELEGQEGLDSMKSDIKAGNFQIALFSVSFSSTPDLAALLHTRSIPQSNISHYSDGEMDRLLEELSLAWDSQEKSQIVNKINQRFLEESPYVPLFYKQSVLVRDARIREELKPSIFDIYGRLTDIHANRK